MKFVEGAAPAGEAEREKVGRTLHESLWPGLPTLTLGTKLCERSSRELSMAEDELKLPLKFSCKYNYCFCNRCERME